MLKNIEVDVLGRWEAGPGVETPNHVMRSLLRHGVMQVIEENKSHLFVKAGAEIQFKHGTSKNIFR